MTHRETNDNQSSLDVSKDRRVKMSIETLVSLLAFAVLSASFILHIEWNQKDAQKAIEEHTRQLTTMQVTMGETHDILKDLANNVGRLDDKLDYLTGARKTRPAASSPLTNNP